MLLRSLQYQSKTNRVLLTLLGMGIKREGLFTIKKGYLKLEFTQIQNLNIINLNMDRQSQRCLFHQKSEIN